MKHWESALISPDITLEDAIAVLDSSGLRIAIVVDQERRLLGTLTDGDVRRALLKHIPLDVLVNTVMCQCPQIAQRDWTRDRVLSVMESAKLLQLPVVDPSGRVVGLETLQGHLDKRTIDNPVFLMAGGFGTRLHPLTHNCPKPMLKVGSKPILELILDSFVNAGFHRFFISTHYLPEMIRDHFGDGKRWGVTITYVYESKPLGTGGALGLLPHAEMDMPLLMMNGDLLTTLDYRGLLDFHNQEAPIASMCVRDYEQRIPYGVVQSSGHHITSIIEKPVHHFFINAGIYVLSPDLVRSVKPGTHIDMPTLLEQTMATGQVVNMYPVHEYWLDIGRMEDFQRAQSEVAKL